MGGSFTPNFERRHGNKRLVLDFIALMHARRMVFIVACATVLLFLLFWVGQMR